MYREEQEWIYISSREEEKIVDIVEEKRKQEKREISSLTRTGVLAQKRSIRNKVSVLSLRERVQSSRLDTSLRSRCITDALSTCLARWKKDVSFLLAREHVLSCIRREEKQLPLLSWNDLSTEMASFALSASSPAQSNGLDKNLLTDMLWSVQMCLCKNVSLSLERSLISPELQILEDCILLLTEPLLFFWNRASANVANKTLINLPELWRREEEERKKNILIDASYLEGNTRTFLQEGKFVKGSLLDQKILEERKDFLEKTLKFKTL